MPPSLLIFAPIAPREVSFYLKVIGELKKHTPDLKFAFISFIQQANKEITSAGYRVYDIYDYVNKNIDLSQTERIEQKFNVKNLRSLVKHETITFGSDEDAVLVKFLNYLEGFDEILKQISSDFVGEKPLILQELGGFVAPLSLFFSAGGNKIPHLFFEPAFFKGRLNFVFNSLSSVPAKLDLNENAQNEVVSYLKSVTDKKEIVVPTKDKHHFQDMGFKKILNKRNILRFSNKLAAKYIYRHKQEYEHISNHTVRTFKMWMNRKSNSQFYKSLDSELKNKKIIYFPFHVQMDYGLTVRSPQYFDQLDLVNKISKIIPEGYMLVAKEHPASVGGFNPDNIAKVISENKNFRLLHPLNNTFDILKNAELVITINSKSGAEAVMMGKHVIALGDSFYSNSGMVTFVKNFEDLQGKINELLQDAKPLGREKIEKFFTTVWNNSYAGELYNENLENLDKFTKSITDFISRRMPQPST